MMIAGYLSASWAVETFGSTTLVWTLTALVLPGSSSVRSTSLASVLYLTRTPVRDGVGSTWPLLRSSLASTGWRSIDFCTRLTSLPIEALFQVTSAASSVFKDLLRRLRQVRENMSPCWERL